METEYDDDYPGINQRNAIRGAQVIQVEGSRLTPLLVALSALALLISGVSLGVGMWSTGSYSRDYKELERENRLLQLKVDEFRIALLNAHIDPNPHVEGEAK